MHFRNVPCSVVPDDPRNPLNILRRLYRPGDYVAFKLVRRPCTLAANVRLDIAAFSGVYAIITWQHRRTCMLSSHGITDGHACMLRWRLGIL